MTLGICVSELAILNLSDQRRVLRDIRDFGFRKVRFEVPWVTVQPRKGSWDWSLVTSARDIAREFSIELLPVLGVHVPKWAWTPVDVEVFAREAAKTLNAPIYEVWNEPNLALFHKDGDPKTFAPIQRAAYNGIKSVQPGYSSKVALAGLAACVDWRGFNFFPWLGPFGWFRNTSPETFLRGILNASAPFDLVAYHPYAISSGFVHQEPTANQEGIARIAKLQGMVNKPPILLTEWGFDMAPGKVTPNTASQWFTKQLALLPGDSYFYNWRDGYGQQFGLVDANNVPRQPLYDTVKKALEKA